MDNVYAIINFKGGVGKTTLTWLLGTYCSLYTDTDKKILLVDLDPQMSLTLAMELQHTGRLKKTYQNWLKLRIRNKETIVDLIKKYYNNQKRSSDPLSISRNIVYVSSGNPGLYLLPSSEILYLLEVHSYKRGRLQNFIAYLLGSLQKMYNFDYIFIDCPPNFTPLTFSVFSCVSKFLVPYNPDIYATKALKLLINTISILRKNYSIQFPKTFYPILNKAKLYRKRLTIESNDFYNDIHRVSGSLSSSFIQIVPLKTYLIEKVNIKRSIQYRSFPLEIFDACKRICQEISLCSGDKKVNMNETDQKKSKMERIKYKNEEYFIYI